MSRILDLKAKRAALWDEAKKLLDTAGDGVTSAENVEKYEKMEADIDNMGREIERLEKAEARDKEMNAAANEPYKNAPQTAKDEKTGRASAAYNNAFWQAMRGKNMSYDVRNDLSIGTDTEGGYLVPDEFERTLVQALEDANIFRTIARTIKTSSGDRKIPVVTSHGEAYWVDEGTAYTDSDEVFGQISLSAYKLAASIIVSEELLNDSVFDIQSYIANEFGRRIGAKEEEAFFVGTGYGTPTDIFADDGGADVGYTAESASVISFDNIYDLFYGLKSAYRRNTVWVMNDSTVKAIRKLTDSNGQYLWQPSAGADTPDTLLNRPIYTSSYVPEIESGAKPIAFGDFSYYWIADRQTRTFRRLNELYAKSGQVGFIATERVDGKLTLGEAVKTLVMA